MNKDKKTYYDTDLYETYAGYVEAYETAQAEYSEDKKSYKEGYLEQKPRRKDYSPDEEAYFGTRMVELIKFLPQEQKEFDNIINKTSEGMPLSKDDEEFLKNYTRDLQRNQKHMYSHATRTLNELMELMGTGIDLDDESIAQIKKIRVSEKKLYQDAQKYLEEHKHEYEAEQQAIANEKLNQYTKDSHISPPPVELQARLPEIKIEVPENSRTSDRSSSEATKNSGKSSGETAVSSTTLKRDDEHHSLKIVKDEAYAHARESDRKMKYRISATSHQQQHTEVNDATRVQMPTFRYIQQMKQRY